MSYLQDGAPSGGPVCLHMLLPWCLEGAGRSWCPGRGSANHTSPISSLIWGTFASCQRLPLAISEVGGGRVRIPCHMWAYLRWICKRYAYLMSAACYRWRHWDSSDLSCPGSLPYSIFSLLFKNRINIMPIKLDIIKHWSPMLFIFRCNHTKKYEFSI